MVYLMSRTLLYAAQILAWVTGSCAALSALFVLLLRHLVARYLSLSIPFDLALLLIMFVWPLLTGCAIYALWLVVALVRTDRDHPALSRLSPKHVRVNTIRNSYDLEV